MSISHQTARLSAGYHRSPDEGVCVMELASMLAGEPFTDWPRSVSPTLAAVLRGYNDGLDDTRRQTLKRYAAESIGTAARWRVEKRRRRVLHAALPDLNGRRGLRAAVGRRLALLDPYSTLRGLAQRVSAQDDDLLHARVLTLLDALVAVGDSSRFEWAPAAAPCEHHCPPPADRRG
jgi:hypothetical protein